MSRIRSIHPGQWTDEDFVECGMAARLLVIGLRNEADDNGVFEWKPTRLKMRLFPADDVDVPALLAEAEACNQVRQFEVDGRRYGAIRNFRAFQNPRSPSCQHPTTPAIEQFLGRRENGGTEEKRGPGRPRKAQAAETPDDEPEQFPQSAEINSLMEREREKEDSPSDSSASELADGSADGKKDEPRGELIVFPVAGAATDPVVTAFEDYQALRRDLVPGCRPLELNSGRRKKLAGRLRDVGGLAGWVSVMARIRGSPFLRGETSRNGFVAIDWLLEPKNLLKVTEGNYDERPHAGGARKHAATTTVDAVRAARAAVGLG